MASNEELFNPFAPTFHADPYPFYHRLRSIDPVHQTPMGFWVLTRYDDVVMVLRDPRFGRDGFEQVLASVYGDDKESGQLPRSMLFRDPPDHTRLRALVSKAFTPRVIEDMRTHIQDIVNRLLDRVQASKASVDTSKPAKRGRRKTGHRGRRSSGCVVARSLLRAQEAFSRDSTIAPTPEIVAL
jgi:cytochrome P450